MKIFKYSECYGLIHPWKGAVPWLLYPVMQIWNAKTICGIEHRRDIKTKVPIQWRTNIRIYSDIRILFSEYPIFEYEYWVLTKRIYSSIWFVIFIFLHIFGNSIRNFYISKYVRIFDIQMLWIPFLLAKSIIL